MLKAPAIAAFAVFLMGASQPPTPSPTKISQPKQAHPRASEKKAATNQKATPPPPIIVNVPQPPKSKAEAAQDRADRDEKAANDRRLNRLTLVSTIFSGLMVVVTALLAAVTAALWCATRNLVKGGEKSAAQQLRAYVYFEEPLLRLWPEKDPTHFEVNVVVVNAGSTWARKFSVRTGLVRRQPDDLSPVFDPTKWPEDDSTIILGPNQNKGFHIGVLTKEDGINIQTGELVVFVIGWIVYEDVVTVPSVQRETRMCRRIEIEANGSVSFLHAEQQNGADEDFPPL